MIYTPDKWVILKVNNGKESVNKVFSCWNGGYLGGTEWRLNSGNVAEKEFNDRWEFEGYSGSKYICYKHLYGMNNYMSSLLNNWKSQIPKDCFMDIQSSYAN